MVVAINKLKVGISGGLLTIYWSAADSRRCRHCFVEKSEGIIVKWNLIFNALTNLVHAFVDWRVQINFGLSSRLVRTMLSANRWAIAETEIWTEFGLSSRLV